jgi:hypothetical protein
MKIISGCVFVVFMAAGVASAQTTPDLQIRIGTSILSPLGGEHPGGTWFSSGPVTIGKPSTATYSFGSTCDAWTVSSDGSLRDDATAAWRIEVTPIRVERHAVRFRLRWVRTAGPRQQLEEASMDGAKSAKLPNGEMELNLGPGESFPVDSVRVPPGARMAGGLRLPCAGTASIRVWVERYPDPEAEHRLIGAELWLIERLPDGSEAQRSEPLAIRGLPGRPFTFYFDSLADGNATLDIYGTLIARRFGEEVFVTVETRSRWAPEPRKISGPQRLLNSEIKVTPVETVDIRLPLLGDEAGPFAKRALSIRIRARQLR